MRQEDIHHRRFAWSQEDHCLFLLQRCSVQLGDGKNSAAVINAKTRISLKRVGERIALT